MRAYFLILAVGSLTFSFLPLEINRSLAQIPEDENIEMLDVFEVPGTAVVREARELSFPPPNIMDLNSLPDIDLIDLPVNIQIDRSLPQPTIMIDTISKTRGIRTSPKPLKADRPPYPRFAREQGWKGVTILRITIEADGKVSSAVTHKSSGHPILDESAIKKVKQWVFVPAKNGEFKIASTVNLPIHFDLNQPH